MPPFRGALPRAPKAPGKGQQLYLKPQGTLEIEVPKLILVIRHLLPHRKVASGCHRVEARYRARQRHQA